MPASTPGRSSVDRRRCRSPVKRRRGSAAGARSPRRSSARKPGVPRRQRAHLLGTPLLASAAAGAGGCEEDVDQIRGWRRRSAYRAVSPAAWAGRGRRSAPATGSGVGGTCPGWLVTAPAVWASGPSRRAGSSDATVMRQAARAVVRSASPRGAGKSPRHGRTRVSAPQSDAATTVVPAAAQTGTFVGRRPCPALDRLEDAPHRLRQLAR
jgi:hypothetical protein